MISLCKMLRKFCLDREWARNAAAFFGAALFVATIWVSIDYQLVILDWIRDNVVVNLAILGAVSVVNLTLMFGSLCLGFSECSEADKNCLHAYRGRGKGGKLFPEVLSIVDGLGTNPKRLPRRPASGPSANRRPTGQQATTPV